MSPNYEDLNELVRLIQPYVGARLFSLPEFESNYKGFTGDGSQSGDHAGKVETSLLWALRPECVDLSRIPDYTQPGQAFAMGEDARSSNRLAGERMVADEVEWLGNKASELLNEYEQLRPAHKLTTFEAVERIWAEVVTPGLPAFKTMQEKWEWQSELPAGSPWAGNRPVPKNWR